MGESTPRELLLRAELRHQGSTIIAHTLEFSDSMVFVQTDRDANAGDRIEVEFSFPGLVSPFELDTQVVTRNVSPNARLLNGLALGFLFYHETERQTLQRLLAVTPTGETSPASAYRVPSEYRVLVVEDDQFVRDAFAFGVDRLLLDAHHVVVDMVADSAEALQRLFEKRYDLAIVDYFLPTANGDRLISRLRSNPGLEHLPIFAFSSAGADARQASLDAGADLFLHKPAVMRNLFPTLVHLNAMRRQT